MKPIKVGDGKTGKGRKSIVSKSKERGKLVRVDSRTWIEVHVDATAEEIQTAIEAYKERHP